MDNQAKIDPIDEAHDLKRRIEVQAAYCRAQQAMTQDEKWHLQEIALLQVQATVNQTIVLEHGFHRLFDVLVVKTSDVINAEIKKLVEGAEGGA